MSNPLFPASYSRLSCYEKCPQQARFRYIDKIPQGPKGPAATRGTELHTSAENFLRGDSQIIHKDIAILRNTLVVVKQSQPFIEHKIAFSQNFAKRVAWDAPDVWFKMVLDSAYLENSTVHVQEWKSGKVYDHHVDQRALYAVGAHGEWPVTMAHVSTYYIDRGTKKTLWVDSQKRKMLVGRFNQRLELMGNEKIFAPRPGQYCRWCDYSRFKGGPCKVG
jgi:CRISPR/Cas system-associated exonuclease Cas4 (RecB family)